MKNCSLLILSIIISFLSAQAQDEGMTDKKNNLFLQANWHFEKRGTVKYCCSNPDYTLGYDRKIAGFGGFGILSGIRTGVYREYVLTGYGWEHPIKSRFFLGGSASCMYNLNSWFTIQVTLLADVLLPNDYKETWSYWAVEPSFYFFISRKLYTCLTATKGSFLFFDPKAFMDKAGFRVGFFF
jgi:hypothetical protein